MPYPNNTSFETKQAVVQVCRYDSWLSFVNQTIDNKNKVTFLFVTVTLCFWLLRLCFWLQHLSFWLLHLWICCWLEIRETEEARYEFHTSLPLDCNSRETASEMRRELVKTASSLTQDLACMRDGSCELEEPEIKGCNLQRKRRDLGSPHVSITMAITYHGKLITTEGTG